MKLILILGHKTSDIETYIKNNYSTSFDIIKTYETFADAHIELMKLLTRADLLVFNDEALGDNPMRSCNLMKELVESNIFKVDEFMHLSIKGSRGSEYTNFILSDIVSLTTYVKDLYTAPMVVNCISSKLSTELKDDDNNKYVKIVRQRAGTSDKRVYLENTENKTVIITDLSQKKYEEKKQNQKQAIPIFKDKRLSKPPQVPPSDKLEEIQYNPYKLPKELQPKKTTRKTGNIILLTGERGSGKSSYAYILGKSASKERKVLLIDANIENLGLSALIEELQEDINTIYLNNFISKSLDCIQLLQDSDKNFNSLNLSLKTIKALGETSVRHAIEMIITKVRYNFDTIIVDVPMSSLNKYPILLKFADSILITSQLYQTNIISLGRLINKINLRTIGLETKHVVLVPISIAKGILGVHKMAVIEALNLLKQITKIDKCDCISECSIHSFNIDNKLYDILKTIIGETKARHSVIAQEVVEVTNNKKKGVAVKK